MGLLMMLLFQLNSWAQAEFQGNSAIPYQTGNSLHYGGDVIIDDQPLQDQRGNSLAVAFNGWLYASHVINNEATKSWKVLMSIDDGLTWNTIINNPLSADWYTVALDIMVCGTSTADLKLYVARIYENDVSGNSILRLSKYDANTGAFISQLRDDNLATPEKFLDVAIASDYYFPAWSAGQYSIGMAYSKTTSSTDYIGFISYADAGATAQPDQNVYTGGMFVRNVAIAYGRSATYVNGRYHVAWEERTNSISDIGEIWTAHNLTYYNGVFTTPLRLENLIAASAGYCRNPSISCQFNNTDNASGNYTEVVLFDRAYNGNTADFDIVGTYNLTASNTDSWSIFGMYAGSSSNDYQPDVNFDPAFNNFLATYYNSTETKLRYLVEYMDLPDPYFWIVITDKYNDANNLVNPYPKVEINPVQIQVAHLWTAERPGGNGVTMFDAEYSTAGIQPIAAGDPFRLKVYPNPARYNIKIALTLSQGDRITINMVDAYGKPGNVLFDGNVPKGESVINADVSGMAAGCYFFRVKSSNSTSTGRLVIIR